jgi:hypothetical protein
MSLKAKYRVANIAVGKYHKVNIAQQISPSKYRRRQISRRKYREAIIATGINIVYPPKTLKSPK